MFKSLMLCFLLLTPLAISKADARLDELVKLSRDGKVLERFGGPGKSLGKYGFLHGVLQHQDKVYVSDILNWKIEQLVKEP